MPSPASNRSPDGGNQANSTSSARAAAEIIAISTRDDFLLEIGEALSGQTSVRPVDSVETALDQIGGNRRTTQLLAVDARDVENIRAVVETLNSQASHMVVLVFANTDTEKQIASQLKGTNVFAVLPLPVDKRKTAAVLEGAIADATSRRPAQAPQRPGDGSDKRFDRNSPITVEPAQADSGSYSSSGDSGSGGKNPLIFIGGGVAVVVAAAAAWFFLRSPATQTTPTAPEKKASVSITASKENLPDDVVAEPTPVVDMPLVNGTVDELLEKARLAMRERRYTEPNSDNALLFYRSAAKADATNGEAKDGLRRVAALLSSRFDDSLAAGRYDEAALTLAHLKAATPDDERVVQPLEARLATAQVTKMLADGNLDRAASLVKGAQQTGAVPDSQITKWKSEIVRRQDEGKQKKLVDLAQEALRDGRLSDPSDSSVKTYADQLKDMGASGAAAYQRLMRDLGGAYMKKAREAAAANRGADVDRWLAEAKAVGISATDLNGFQRELATSKQKAAAAEAERLASLARDRIRDGKLTDPANDSAAFYLTSLQSADANNAYVAAGSRELATRLLDRASTAARDGKSVQSEADLAQARRWGADPKDILAIQQAAAARKVAPTRAATGAQNSSTAGSAAPPDLSTKLKRIRSADPEYPERALSQRIQGSVTVEFTVNVKGEPQDVHVVAAEPAGTFDRAALAAVKRWRYAPVVVDNVPQEVPARTIVRFQMNDK
ncbi:MAG: energy transducer TonB [Gammaproteobacteria bacterium]